MLLALGRTIRALTLFSLLTASVRAQGIDQNANGMSDLWEAAYGATGLDPNGDADGDGFTNLQEARAGTNPFDARSRPALTVPGTPAPNTVRLRWPSVAGKSYTVEVSSDFQNWIPITAAWIGDGTERVVDLDVNTTIVPGGMSYSRWTGLAGSVSLANVKSYAATGSPAPNATASVTSVETAQSSPDLNSYGQWLRGWIVAPTTGSYTFWVAGDDQSELWLSTDANPAGKQLIASSANWTNFRQWTKYPSQQSAPRTLEAGRRYYLEAFLREFSAGDHLSVAWTLPGGSTQTVIAGSALAPAGQSLAAFAAAAGGRTFYWIASSDVDSDGDGVTDYEERLIGYNPNNSQTVPRVNDRDGILALLAATNTLTVGTPEPRAYEATNAKGRFTFFRSGNLNPLTIRYSVGGTATPATDYVALSGTVVLPVGQNSVSIDVTPVNDGLLESAESVSVTLLPDASYQIGNPATATVTIDDAADVVFIATLRPEVAQRSGGSGYATLRMAGNKLFADFSLGFGNLNADQLDTQIYVSTSGSGGSTVLTQPTGQITRVRWNFQPAAGLTTPQIVAALEEGRLWARVRSSAVTTGEIFGRFVKELAWQTMPTPQTPPAASAAPATDGEASRFLVQATFGPTAASIAALRSGGQTYASWINAQIALPITRHLPYYQARRAELLARDPNNDGWQTPRNEAFWQAAIRADDQLRQRMALALSEIIVISQFGSLDSQHEATTQWYDMLLEEAFGNYRTLLGRVTRSPMMGEYLSMIRNAKPDLATGREPDENYAREIMQLFSIGLSQLHPDGTLKLDADGLPIPTYSQNDIRGLAHVFTGWGPFYDPLNPPRWSDGSVAAQNDWFWWGWDALNPMSFYPAYADQENRTIVGGNVISGALVGDARLNAALDVLFNHPNVGPFLARQLIQRFVTSNPSPGYVFRVASAFANNGSGVRGDLGATLRAVLLDYEARTTDVLADTAFGKLREPLLRMAHLLRACEATTIRTAPGDSRLFLNLQYSMPEQAPLLSPSVFNFFQPVYSRPGAIGAAGLLSPEFQILTDTTVVSLFNNQYAQIFWGTWTSERTPGQTDNVNVVLNLDSLVAILNTAGLTPTAAQQALLDELSRRLLAGRMSAGLRTEIMQAFGELPSWYGYANDRQRSRVGLALGVIMASPEFNVQR
ncbi:MAG: DUF1800 family protein [Verrucomicrobia bacterium]|nr:DUF1800 family protein [Verrucomicrobiota bacterium]